ncbi:hypothetical protein DM01DRAFT_1236832 [Hesseltinella vesiculosa]|uniref:P-loop containing nucleoside triphosphate hydrolase protein n=1 Tax=Hesseltinella vesiculosa TaxID=101127 RepID=A0A1X2GN69_9FUNG|nr:hypothetical protein DM01DRAFT_1236832 [Hesseltinella vesiculosa]
MNNLPNFILPTGPRLKPQRQPASRSVPSSSSSTSISPSQSICDDVQWDEKYTPTSVDDLVVRKQRIDAIKALIQGSALHKREGYKLLLLKGPAGSCKSTAFRVLVSSLGYQIIEWENPTRTGGYDADDYETLAGRFERFMMQSTGSHTLTSNRPKILFFDDIPDLTTDSVRQQFQAVLTSYIQSQRVFFLVIAISDAYLAADRAGRRYGQESRLTNAGDLMTKDMIATGKCTELEFNPVTQFNVKKVLNRILQAERLSVAGNKALVDRIAVECHGDLRCSILTLQLYTLGQETSLKRKRGHVHGRYEPLELFHLVGKVLFAKRDDGVLQSKPHLMLDNCGNNHHTVLGWIYFNYHPFLTDIDQAAAIMGHMSDADVLGTNWMARVRGV